MIHLIQSLPYFTYITLMIFFQTWDYQSLASQ